MASKYPLTTFYLLSVVFSAVVLGGLAAAGAGEELFVLGTAGPAVAAVAVVRLRDGRGSVGRFLKSTLSPKFGVMWWAAAVVLPLVVTAAALIVTSMRAGIDLDTALWASFASSIPLLVVITLINGIPEEIGWRGLMLPLAQRRFSALGASLVIGFWWAVWHLPIFFIEGSFHDSLSDELGFVPAFGIWTAATMVFSVGYTWLYNSAGGGSLATGVLHGAANTWIATAIADLSPAQTVELFVWLSVGWLLVAIYLHQVNGGETLTHRGSKVVDYMSSPGLAVLTPEQQESAVSN